ncbi:hypothetical protein Pst134EA_003176 [Puccinia striiformis f. sp. tritici]|uniref:hypothetical protein n=1 Tax=Puccinia striiformis f. sp. tritici TaxID=168172 RepID=UPI002007E364|nr:hypothetical protein Pst134EA_003176 [Puccinia striiformis f. sp. tritici]KAH9472568.1 hypothetical protein Pst134EA_003176 [Puccinia striiformis f. sp. tritici]
MEERRLHQRANFPSNLEITHIGGDGILEDEVSLFGIAAKTWEASFDLLDYLLPPPLANTIIEFDPASPLLSSTSHIIDLGSGTCHLPIGIAKRLASSTEASKNLKITVTDLPEVLPLLERKISSAIQEISSGPRISARSLRWGNTQETIDLLSSIDVNHQEPFELLITCSDLVFFPFLFAPLLRTLLILTSPQYLPVRTSSSPVIVFGYKERSAVKEFPFFSLLGRYFKLEPILSRSDPADPWELIRDQERHSKRSKETDSNGNKIYLLRATRHPSTLNLDLDPIIHHSQLEEEDNDRIGTQEDPLYLLGDGSAIDQWEWILLSNLTDHSLFS